MRLTLIITFILLSLDVQGQTLYGIVVNGETGKALPNVMVMNVTTQKSTQTNEHGDYSISAKDGDMILYTTDGFHPLRRLAHTGKYVTTELFTLSLRLQEYILRPDYTPFQKDSAELSELYEKELNTQPVKPGFSNANGGGFQGLIGSAVQKMSKSYKQNKQFKEDFQKDIEQRFIDTRYTPALVTELTGLKGDDLVFFMNSNPMEYDFARHGTDLEIKVWIRDNFKKFRPMGSPADSVIKR